MRTMFFEIQQFLEMVFYARPAFFFLPSIENKVAVDNQFTRCERVVGNLVTHLEKS